MFNFHHYVSSVGEEVFRQTTESNISNGEEHQWRQFVVSGCNFRTGTPGHTLSEKLCHTSFTQASLISDSWSWSVVACFHGYSEGIQMDAQEWLGWLKSCDVISDTVWPSLSLWCVSLCICTSVWLSPSAQIWAAHPGYCSSMLLFVRGIMSSYVCVCMFMARSATLQSAVFPIIYLSLENSI